MNTLIWILFGVSITLNVMLLVAGAIFIKRAVAAIDRIMAFDDDVEQFERFLDQALERFATMDSRDARVLKEGIAIMRARMGRYTMRREAEEAVKRLQDDERRPVVVD